MTCPHCKKKLDFIPPVLRNLEAYHKMATAKTSCCGKLVNVFPNMQYIITPYIEDKKVDDWGN